MTRITKMSFAMPVANWPSADQAGWLLALRPKDYFNANIGYASRWKASTRNLIEAHYGHFLAWLESTDQLDRSSTPAERVSLERVTAYWRAQQDAGLAPHTIAGRMQNVGNALQAIAPDHDWKWIRLGAYRLQSKATPIHDLTQRMQPTEDLLALGLDMMHAAEHDRFRTATDRATLFRDGLIISILALTLLRLANLTSITVGQHLTRRGDHWHLSFEPASTKGGRRMEFRFPDRLVPSLTRYVDKHRPMLLKCTRKPLPPTDALFISQHGTHMTTGAVALQVKARTLEAFGVAINPHAFRHAGVTTYVTTNPGGASDIKYLLGHTSEPTGEKYYNKAKIVDAAQRYQETIHAKLRQLKLGLD